MKLWSAFYPYTLVYCPNLPVPLIDEHLRLACIEFCEQSRVWRRWLDPVATVAGQKVYDLNLDPNQELVQLEVATLAAKPLILTTAEQLNDDGEIAGRLPAVFMVDRTQFSLTQNPYALLPILTQVTLKPSLAATGIADDVFMTYAPAIAKGAIASLLMIPGDSANPMLSTQCRQEFLTAISMAGFDRVRAFVRAPLRVQSI